MITSKSRKGEIKTRTDYVETVRSIPQGEVRYFDMIGTVYTGITSACTRLKSEGFDFEVKSDRNTNQLYVHRKK